MVSNRLMEVKTMKAYVIDVEKNKFVIGFTGHGYEWMDVSYKSPFKISRAIKNIELKNPKTLLFPTRELAEKIMNSCPNNMGERVIRVNVDLANSINAKAMTWSAEWLWNYMANNR